MKLTLEESTKAAELVEEWRAALGFKPWFEYMREANALCLKHGFELGRRSGKTTHAILHALAACVVTRRTKLFFGDEWNSGTNYCVNIARDVIAKFGLDILPVTRRSHEQRPRPGVDLVYFDHYQPPTSHWRRAPRLCSECYKPGHRPEDHAGWEPR